VQNVYIFTTKGIVEPWEGIITLSFFFALVLTGLAVWTFSDKTKRD
jgi:hypothetical protein